MLTKETLAAVAALEGLTDAQYEAITDLAAKARENELVKERQAIGTAFASAVGAEYKGGDLAEFLTSHASGLVAKTTELSAALEDAKKGADAHLKAKLEAAQAQLKETQTQYAQAQSKHAQDLTAFEAKMHDAQVGYAMKAATAGLQFSSAYPAEARAMLIGQAERDIKAGYEVKVDADGGLTFYKDGAPALNPANGLKPYTAQELIAERLAFAIDKGQGGAGSKPGNGGSKPGNGGGIFSLTATNRVQADVELKQHLHSKGLVFGSEAYNTEFMKLRAELKVAELPLR